MGNEDRHHGFPALAAEVTRMIRMKCPVCAGEVPGTLLRSESFLCPVCKEPLRVREFSVLWAIPLVAGGFWLTFLIAERLGLKGSELHLVTLLVGFPATWLLVCVVGVLWGWVFCLPLPLERDPGPERDDGGILHINSPPKLQKPPQ